jgi:hypothetical protein
MGRLCKWSQNENGAFQTECGNVFELTHGAPPDNGMRFCCYCGDAIETVGYEGNAECADHPFEPDKDGRCTHCGEYSGD